MTPGQLQRSLDVNTYSFCKNENRKKLEQQRQDCCSSNAFLCLFLRRGIVVMLENVQYKYLHNSDVDLDN